MPDEELSKRINDLHKRLDDFRGDVNTRFGIADQHFAELRGDVSQRFNDLNQRLTTLT